MTETANKKKTFLLLLFIVIALTVSINEFFTIYRLLIFNLIPHDNYEDFLLYIIGKSDCPPKSPMAYRYLSVLIAVPFFYILPAYHFANLGNLDINHLKACEAIAFSSFLFIILTQFVIYFICRKHLKYDKNSSIIIGLSSYFLSSFISKIGVDPFAIFIISLIILFENKKLIFLIIMITSIAINEKILIIFSLVYIFRMFYALVVKKVVFEYSTNSVVSFFSLTVYFLIRKILDIPGNETQTDIQTFIPSFIDSIKLTLSLKGVILNLIPIFIVFLLSLFNLKNDRQKEIKRFDFLMFTAFLLIALLMNLKFNTGRIIMYTYPFFITSIGVLLKNK